MASLLLFAPVREHGLPTPRRAREGDAGFDLPLCLITNADGPSCRVQRGAAIVQTREGKVVLGGGALNTAEKADGASLHLDADTIAWVRTGWAVQIPEGCEGQVRGRSGLAFKSGVTVWHLGTIDASYRGEVWVALVNDGEQPVRLVHGERIAQLVVAPICTDDSMQVTLATLTSTTRGSSGFGSTGR